jgi:DNA-binding beta-propeller fold protein YncE
METYSYVWKWGGYGAKEGQFNFPFDVAIDRHGHVFVADGFNHRIQRFFLNGKFEITWGQFGNAEGEFMEPWGVFVDCDRDEVYVVDTGNHRIQVFDSDGNYLRKWGSGGQGDGQLLRPRDIAMDPIQNDTVFVMDSGNNRIQVFDLKGVYKYQWGKPANPPSILNGEFNEPRSLAFDTQGVLYVVDSGNNRIQYFTNNGTYIDNWGGFGNNNNQFVTPVGITIDSFDKIYVSEKSHQVKKFDSTGNFITSFGHPGPADGELNNPEGIATIEGGKKVYVYVADSVNQRLEIFALELAPTILTHLPH